RLERDDLVQVIDDDRRCLVRLDQPLIAEVVRPSIDEESGTQWRRALARAVEAAGGRRREDLLRVATWRLATDDPIPAAQALAAARRASASHDPALALALVRRTWDVEPTVAAGLAFV